MSKYTPEQLAQELSELLTGASLELQDVLGTLAENSRMFTEGGESPQLSKLTDLLTAAGRRADRAISADRLAAIQIRNRWHYAQQQARRAGLGA